MGLIGALAFAGPAAGQPPGNNGDVKIDGVPFDNDNNNEPHVNCEFRLKFFNFDPGQTGTVIFTVQPPTGQFDELARFENVRLGNGLQVFPTTGSLDTFDLGLQDDGFTPHPQQGFHVKVTVETGQGAGKHKVFWIRPCPVTTPPPTVAPTTRPPGALPITGGDYTGLWVLASGLLTAGSGLLLFARRLRRRSET